jgi:hypothetical protein
MLTNILNSRQLPPLKDREQMLSILAEEIYGHMPPAPDKLTWQVQEHFFKPFCAGKATISRVELCCQLPGGEFTFPVYCAVPTAPGKHPFFIHICFRDNVPDRYMPTEELIDNGFAVLSFCYNDVTTDDGDFSNGLAGVLQNGSERISTAPGKLAMWAWAAQRALDYALTLPALDPERSIVCGHSRLGKTALLAAATDTRFRFAYSNNSGCSGAAITRDKEGERVKQIYTRFPYWFCENYQKYMDNEHSMPCDQHYLVAAIAPRFVCVGSASEDTWADPLSELLCCAAATPAYEAVGLPGLVHPNRLPEVGETMFDGSIGYHLRRGPHYFGREDWLKLISFVNSH